MGGLASIISTIIGWLGLPSPRPGKLPASASPAQPAQRSIADDFNNPLTGCANPYWNRYAVGCAWVKEQPGAIRFVVGPVPEGILSDAELSDYRVYERGTWPWRPPLRMTVRARASNGDGDLVGTAGFGFWNYTFTTTGQVEQPPQAVWYFYASPQSVMTLDPSKGIGHGWRAQVLNAPSENPGIMEIGNWFWRNVPLVHPLMYALVREEVGEGESIIKVPLTEWHTYRMDWLTDCVQFYVDEQLVYTVHSSPAGPLGFVAWLDNSMMDMGEGSYVFKHLPSDTGQWFDMSSLIVEPIGGGA